MSSPFIYRPIIKWKAGEYKALKNLDSQLSTKLFPLIQLVPPGFDFERRALKTTIDEQLKNVPDDYLKNWGRPSAIDFNLIKQDMRMSDGRLPIEYIFEEFKQRNVSVIPVTSIDRDQHYQEAVTRLARTDGNGVCIRLSLVNAYNPHVINVVKELLTKLKIGTESADLIVDIAAPQNYLPIEGFATGISAFLRSLLSVGDWRSTTICGSSIPQSMAAVSIPFTLLPRHEWKLFLALKRVVKEFSDQVITFGDYGIVHPLQQEPLDPRKLNQAAAIKYTIDDGWIIYRGRGVRKGKKNKDDQSSPRSPFDEGFAQYFRLCRELSNSEHFMRAEYSAGDNLIHDTANLTQEQTKNWTKKTGNSTTWLAAGMNHHFTKILRDLSNLGAS